MAEQSVVLVSPIPGLTVTLEHAIVDFHPQIGTRTVERAKQLKFTNGRCVAPAAWVDLIKSSSAYTGERGRKTVWFEDEALAGDFTPTGPQAIRGAVAAPVRKATEPPLPDWDTLGARVISEKVEAGQVKDLLAAVAWESSNKKRKTVLTALAGALAGQGDVEATEPDVAVVAESFEAEAA